MIYTGYLLDLLNGQSYQTVVQIFTQDPDKQNFHGYREFIEI